MSSPVPYEEPYEDSPTINTTESGYASGNSSQDSLPEVYFSRPHLKFLNSQLQKLEPQDILRWCITSLPGLYQTTAFGLTGLATLDILSKLSGPIKPNVDLIFIDTLHHFDETLSLVDRVRRRYGTTIHIYKPAGTDTAAEFSTKHGNKLWETNEELYDYVVKHEPAQRAYSELQVKAVLTGRRRSQGGKRGDLDIIEIDDNGLIKINPLANWSFAQVQEYIHANNVPFNDLLNNGYKSVGDWHSTQPVSQGEDERSGRWKGRAKTECGIHNPKSRYALFLRQQAMKQQEEELSQALQKVALDA
ncbi:Phosphoadenosine phosphosulfate reductase thioredoxin [Lindgomyces ingoldianus]|uniref:Phosphoadenosine phosphosulfate reductase thioredoxin n=1 Tax=Lindgomyces ingoldianus TaxID=673940 RepID=A0ACB6QJS3_9PLEO|nr:Phosphoadenosine phosphosulfate reductase thioredoxin [Lindgomyces ingoldianus]KAF2467176.1 Phosphoadenosine phosphosulfate reductase thioredoxin [Lindgomyces ingoldianus]